MTPSPHPAPPPAGAATPDLPRQAAASPPHRLLTELRGGPDVPQRPLDARALAALATNPGCRRRALLDGAGVDKSAVAQALGSPAPFGQSQFAFIRGNAFEARVKADGGEVLLTLLCEHTGEDPPEPGEVTAPDLAADGPAGRAARTRLALAEAAADGGWTLLDHPMLTLEVAGTTAFLEPDALAVAPGRAAGRVIEIKSFPILDGSARTRPRWAQRPARRRCTRWRSRNCGRRPNGSIRPTGAPGRARAGPAGVSRRTSPTSRPPACSTCANRLAVTRRQLARLTRIEEIAARAARGRPLRARPDGSAVAD